MLSFACNRVFVVIEWSGWRYKEMTDLKEEKENLSKKKSRARRAFEIIFSIKGDQADPEDIKQRIADGGRVTGTNAVILVCAIMIASIGLLNNSTAVITGAMLISPLMGSILALAYGTVTGNKDMLVIHGIGFAVQIIISLLTSTIFFLLAPIKTPTSELLARTSPSFYDVLIAIFGGVAGIIGNTRKDKANNVIPGVAIATALMPPLCTCGYSLASGNWRMLGGAAYLFLINSYFIFGSSEIILYLMDLPEKKVVDPKVLHKNRIRRRIITLIILIPCFLFGASLAYLP